GLGLVAGLLYFSLVFRAHIGYRFVLMLLPLLYLLAAAGWASAVPRWGARAAAAVAAVSLIEGLAYAGNPLAFTSAAVQPKRSVFRWLADSNLDWGQDRERIAEHVRARGAGHTQLEPVHLMPGHNTIGTNALAGLWDPEQHRWVRENLEPGGHFLYTYPWFDVDEATFDRFLSEARRLRPAAWAGAACAGRPLVRYGPGSRVPLVADRGPAAGEGWLACLESAKGADVALRVPAGRVRYGTLAADGSCTATLLDQGDVAWYRLEPGTHALCLAEIPNRRAWLPYRLETTWVIRGHAVALEARPHVFSGPIPPPPESASPRSSSPPPPPAG
ncbi:MAG TPA: hypothetical protein VFM29_09005, partial [Vicinamibacteria bacterium]|nr:hypothetical protein [Vicinamibacteria bacterium]